MGVKNKDPYIPALKYHILTPLYDVVAGLMGDKTIKLRLLEHTQVAESDHLLDVGCGTGTFLEMVNRAHPKAHLAGLDGDPRILDFAKRRFEKSNSVSNSMLECLMNFLIRTILLIELCRVWFSII